MNSLLPHAGLKFSTTVAFALALATSPLLQAESTPNRLAGEKSPYLLQHAHNPVDWYPWGEEAFAKARAENKPIFLSIGYSTCHWCHVMEEESFENEAIAADLNTHFVSIKVDREERPDIDHVYMTFVQASTGSGGWPLNVWLTPELKPFFGGTYFAPADSGRRPGFKTVLNHIASLWAEDSARIRDQSTQMLATLAHDLQSTSAATELPFDDLRAAALTALAENFDPIHAGFGSGQKFPSPANLELLLDVAALSPDADQRALALQLTSDTLHAMITGGLRDYVGGGFHRYTVDEAWRVPHFEKMLYDQAQITSVLLSTWQLAPNASLRDAALSTLNYVRTSLRHPDGGFFSAEDADSVRADAPDTKVEGAFYTWTAAEIAAQLDPAEVDLFNFAFGVEETGNVSPQHDPRQELTDQNVLYRAHSDAECAAAFNLSAPAVATRLQSSLAQLYTLRDQRPHPSLDDKVVTAWNGLMISAFARAGQVFSDPTHTTTARRAAQFLRDRLYDESTGKLFRSYREGRRDDQGFAEDYSFVIQGLLDLYESDLDTRWLTWALQLQEKQIELFWDDTDGGFFATDGSDTSVILRMKVDHDGSEPAATSIAVRNLGRLAALFHQNKWLERANAAALSLASNLQRNPLALPQLLASVGWLDGTAQQALIHGQPEAPATTQLLEEVQTRFHPRRVVLRIDPRSRPFFEAQVPFVAGLPDEMPAEATAYICENFVCQMPTTERAELAALLDR